LGRGGGGCLYITEGTGTSNLRITKKVLRENEKLDLKRQVFFTLKFHHGPLKKIFPTRSANKTLKNAYITSGESFFFKSSDFSRIYIPQERKQIVVMLISIFVKICEMFQDKIYFLTQVLYITNLQNIFHDLESVLG